MADNIKINEVIYPGVEAIAATNENGDPVMYYMDAVRHNKQELTEAQKQQVIENIGLKTERWEFTLEDGSVVTKEVYAK